MRLWVPAARALRRHVIRGVRYQLCLPLQNLRAQNAGTSAMDTGHRHLQVKHPAIAYLAGMNDVILTTQEKLQMAVITHGRSGWKSFDNFQRVQDVKGHGMQFHQDPISDTRRHGQKTTSSHYRKEVPMIFPISSHCVTNVSSEKTLVPNPLFEADAPDTLQQRTHRAWRAAQQER